MKKLMFALCFIFGGIVAVTAQQQQQGQDTTSNQYRTETQSQYPQDAMGQQQDRERIQATELPDEVKRALEGEEYRGWLISGAFKSQGGDQSMNADTTSTDPNRQGNVNATGDEDQEVYIVELKNGAETKTVHFDANGQKMEGMEEGQNSQNNQYNQNDQGNQYNQNDPNNQNNQNGQYNQNQRNTPGNEYNQNNQNDRLNQSDQMDQTTPSDRSSPTDPNAADRPGQPQSGNEWQTEQSPGTPPGQSPQTPQPGTPPDQSSAKEQK